jgi:hypothetical protein
MAITPTGVQPLARSAGIRPDHIVECRRVAVLAPPLPIVSAQRINTMPTALALFRGDTLEFILAKAQYRSGEVSMLEYVLIPAPIANGLGGNLSILENYAKLLIPLEQRAELPLIPFEPFSPPSVQKQTEDLSALVTVCKANLRTVGGLLSTIVQGMGLIIINAPRDITARLNFIQGLLTFLPAPVRMTITFSTHVGDPAQTKTQIKFMNSAVNIEKHAIFDWETGKLQNAPSEDPYTKFIISQLRLDSSLVIEETEKLARTAVWRSMRRETMANALKWASERAKLDRLVTQGMPADRGKVAGVLREDPTLPDELRISYAKHLVAMSLAINDSTNTDIIPTISVQYPDVANAVYDQMWNAASTDKAGDVYRLAEDWISQAPMGVDVSRWRPLLSMAAMAQVNALLAGPAEPLVEFLRQLNEAPPSLQLEGVVAQIIGLVRKRSYNSPEIAQMVLQLGITYLPLGGLQRLMADQQLLAQLPPTLRNAFVVFGQGKTNTPLPGMIARASEVYGDAAKPGLLMRFSEWALAIQRSDLFDADALRSIVEVVNSPGGKRYENIVQAIVHDLSHINHINRAGPDGQCSLITIQLARRRYEDAAMLLVFYQDMVYQAGQLETLMRIAREAYRNAPLDPRGMAVAMEVLQRTNLKAPTMANAEIGALEGCNWPNEMEVTMRHLSQMLFQEQRMIALMDMEAVLRLLQANMERGDTDSALRLATAIIGFELTFNRGGAAQVMRVYGIINNNTEFNEGPLEVMRLYVRRAQLEQASQLPRLLGEKYGEAVRAALEATYRMRLITGGADLISFAEKVKSAEGLLLEMAQFYNDKETPSINKLRNHLKSMPGGLSDAERARLSGNLSRMAEQIYGIYSLHGAKAGRRGRGDAEARQQSLVRAQISPTTAVEALLWLGGSLSQGTFFKAVLERESTPFLFGQRSVNTLLKESDQTVSLLDGLLSSFADESMPEINRNAFIIELDGIWASISLYQQRQIQNDLAEASQILSQLLVALGDKGGERAVQAGNYSKQLYIGKQQPRTVIEALKWLSGYFANEHPSQSR